MKDPSQFSMSWDGTGAGGEAASSPPHLPAAESIEVLAARRLLQLAQWRQTLLTGTDEERVALVSTLRDIDIAPVYSILDAEEREVAETSSQARMFLALDALRVQVRDLAAEGRYDEAATLADLRMSVLDVTYRDTAGRIDQSE